MGNYVVGGRSFFAASGSGESSDPYVPGMTNYTDVGTFTVTFTVDTAIYASGDVVANPVEIPLVARLVGQPVHLRSIVLLDKSDQKSILDVVFLNANTTLGTLNAAVSVSDTNAETILGSVQLVAADYVDLVGSAVATKIVSAMLPMTPAAASKSIWVALISRGTPTYGAASDVKATFGFSRT